jgi:hypothetical protein
VHVGIAAGDLRGTRRAIRPLDLQNVARIQQESASFLKKRSKKLLTLVGLV